LHCRLKEGRSLDVELLGLAEVFMVVGIDIQVGNLSHFGSELID
jgi:hypothetical protein